jgi:uncharacterized protein
LRIPIDWIDTVPKQSRFSEILDIAREGILVAVRFPSPICIVVDCYRSGRDIFFQGELKGEVVGDCGRCLESFPFAIEKKFDFVLTPDPLPTKKNRELAEDEMGLSLYCGDDIDLSPSVREQALLALPLQPLCSEDCRGLCASCGTELNQTDCGCASPGDPRMAVFRNLQVER